MLKSKFKSSNSSEDNFSNPMDGVSNLSDAMLVLAVGIMLALVINWKIDIKNVNADVHITDESMSEIDIENKEEVSDVSISDLENNYKKTGTVYTDVTTGKTYVVVED